MSHTVLNLLSRLLMSRQRLSTAVMSFFLLSKKAALKKSYLMPTIWMQMGSLQLTRFHNQNYWNLLSPNQVLNSSATLKHLNIHLQTNWWVVCKPVLCAGIVEFKRTQKISARREASTNPTVNFFFWKTCKDPYPANKLSVLPCWVQFNGRSIKPQIIHTKQARLQVVIF